MIKKIMPSFKDDQDKIIVVAMIIASMFLVFVPALLVVLFGKNYVSESTYEISKAFFNFELLLFLISLIFVIPVVGWILGTILGPLMMIFNVIICIINLCAVAKGAETKVPVGYEFV
jgi:uncharacterized membrane protein